MDLVSRISAFSLAVANYLRDSVKPRLLPVGGAVGQVLTKSGTADFATTWRTLLGGPYFSNTSIPTSNTVIATAETLFGTQYSVPANTLAVGSVIETNVFGTYTASILLQSFTFRLKLGNVNLLAQKATGSLLGTAKSPWSAKITSIVTASGIVSSGVLFYGDNSFTIFGGDPVVAPSLSQVNAFVASAQWGAAGNSVTLQGFSVEVRAPT